MLSIVKGKFLIALLLMLVFALSRWPGLMPDNFSAAYAIAFCAGVFFPRRMAWWIPIVTLLATDIALNCYYQFAKGIDCFTIPVLIYMLGNYGGYAFLIWLGKSFKPKASFVSLLGGGLFGALLFYFITNTMSWLLNPFHNPEYAKNLTGWIWALTKGTGGWPETWEFFRNTLLSGGLFTGLFVGAMKASEAAEESEETSEESDEEPAEKPEEAKA
jgi:hypothetical protein